MWKAMAAALLILGGCAALAERYTGYERAGNYYLNSEREKRKSVVVGGRSRYHGYYGPVPRTAKAVRSMAE